MSGHWRYLLVPVSVTGDGFPPPKAVDPRGRVPTGIGLASQAAGNPS
jgi:hypothetical protein